MSEIAIRATHLGKQYVLGESQRFFERLTSSLPLRRGPPDKREVTRRSSFWAIDDINFDIREGEAVGIIGRNGAGKSTLLKVLSRITEPSRGQASIHGRLASLLEVGTGFHPELTGRENIFMNGSLLGMRRAEIARSFDEIVDFAGVDRFVDTPVKRYSSGMYVRLAFSVAAHLEPEILIVDEVLAVGDVQFQRKCLGKMEGVRQSGRTVLFVSHNMTAVRSLTTRCILLKQGKVAYDGNSDRAIELYSESVGSVFEQGGDLTHWPRAPLNLTRSVEFRALAFSNQTTFYEADQTIVIDVVAEAREAIDSVRIQGTILDVEGGPIGTFFCADDAEFLVGERKTLRVLLDVRLGPGRYFLSLGLVTGNESLGHLDHDVISDVLPFEVGGVKGADGTLGTWYKSWGPVRLSAPRMLDIGDAPTVSVRAVR